MPTNPLQLGHEVRNGFESAGPIDQEPTELSPQVINLLEDRVPHQFLSLGILRPFGRHLDPQECQVLDNMIVQLLLNHIAVEIEARNRLLSFG